MTKFVYTFGGKTAEGKADMKNLWGGGFSGYLIFHNILLIFYWVK